jgi:hypothetical protein
MERRRIELLPLGMNPDWCGAKKYSQARRRRSASTEVSRGRNQIAGRDVNAETKLW